MGDIEVVSPSDVIFFAKVYFSMKKKIAALYFKTSLLIPPSPPFLYIHICNSLQERDNSQIRKRSSAPTQYTIFIQVQSPSTNIHEVESPSPQSLPNHLRRSDATTAVPTARTRNSKHAAAPTWEVVCPIPLTILGLPSVALPSTIPTNPCSSSPRSAKRA